MTATTCHRSRSNKTAVSVTTTASTTTSTSTAERAFENPLLLPIIDITPFEDDHDGDNTDHDLSSDNKKAKQVVAEQIAAACRTHGAFYVKSGDIGGLTETLRRDVFQAARDFFALPEAVKKDLSFAAGGDGLTRGYIGIGG